MARKLLRLLSAASLFAAFQSAAVPTARAASLNDYLPKSGVMAARMMAIVTAPEDEKIAQKMQAAIANDQKWFLDYVKQHETDSGLLPYNPRFGISKEEYERIAHLKLQLREIARFDIKVKPGPQGGWVLDAPANAKALTGFSFAADGKSATTPEGTLPASDDIHAVGARLPTGDWDGVSFATAGDPQNGAPSITLALGKRVKEGDGIMYYDVSASSKGPERGVVLLYPLK
jgi:hypothetical protein